MNLYNRYIEESCENADNGYCIAKCSCNYRCSDRCRYYSDNGLWEDYEAWEEDYYNQHQTDWDYYNNGDFED